MLNLFETPRLAIRMMTPEDAPFILQLFNAPTWLQFLGDRNVRTLEDARAYITDIYLKNHTDNGYGAYLVTLRDSGEPIGICGLFRRPYLPVPDLGYSLLPAFEGKGYAFEAASATMDYVGSHLGKTELRAIVSEANTRSVRLLEKLGFVFMEKVQPPGEERMVLVYDVNLS